MRKAQLQSAILVIAVATGVIGVILISRCSPQEPPTFESPVAQRTTPAPQLVIGDVITTSVGISWDDYVQVGGESGDWIAVIDFELRKGGGGVVDVKQHMPNCSPSQSQAGEGWCGLPVITYWATDWLEPGDYEVFVRLTWTNVSTGEVVYGYLEGEASHDGQYFFLLKKFTASGNIYMPKLMKGAK